MRARSHPPQRPVGRNWRAIAGLTLLVALTAGPAVPGDRPVVRIRVESSADTLSDLWSDEVAAHVAAKLVEQLDVFEFVDWQTGDGAEAPAAEWIVRLAEVGHTFGEAHDWEIRLRQSVRLGEAGNEVELFDEELYPWGEGPDDVDRLQVDVEEHFRQIEDDLLDEAEFKLLRNIPLGSRVVPLPPNPAAAEVGRLVVPLTLCQTRVDLDSDPKSVFRIKLVGDNGAGGEITMEASNRVEIGHELEGCVYGPITRLQHPPVVKSDPDFWYDDVQLTLEQDDRLHLVAPAEQLDSVVGVVVFMHDFEPGTGSGAAAADGLLLEPDDPCEESP